ncbi:MAG: hypothetical protein ACXWGX_12540 [Usitatibacter sp.]
MRIDRDVPIAKAMTPQSLEPPTDYRTTRAARLGYAMVAGFAFAFAGALLFVMAGRPSRLDSWIVWLFVLAVALPSIAFGFHSCARAIQSPARLHVTHEGFTYRGVLREHHVYWSSVVSVERGVRDSSLLTLDLSSPELPSLRVDLGGLSPSGIEFMRQVHRFAPVTLEERGLARQIRKLVQQPWLAKLIRKLDRQPKPRYATPEEIPDFDKLRAEVEAVATGKDREDLLRNLDQLEQAWKSRLDPALQPPRKSP